ncbi:MAG: hypothetical protein WBB28_01715 [Crinalium sp.]
MNNLLLRIAEAQVRSLAIMLIIAEGEYAPGEFDKKNPWVKRDSNGRFFKHSDSEKSEDAVGSKPGSESGKNSHAEEVEVLAQLGINYKDATRAIEDFKTAYFVAPEHRQEIQSRIDKAKVKLAEVNAKFKGFPSGYELFDAYEELRVAKLAGNVLSKTGGFDDLSFRYNELLELSNKLSKTSEPLEKKHIEDQIKWRSGVIKSEIKYGDLVTNFSRPDTSTKENYESLIRRLQKDIASSGTARDFYEKFPAEHSFVSGIVPKGSKGGGQKIPPETRKQIMETALKQAQKVQSLSNTPVNVVLEVISSHRAFAFPTLATKAGQAMMKNPGKNIVINLVVKNLLKISQFFNDPNTDGLISIGNLWLEDSEEIKGLSPEDSTATVVFHEMGHLIELRAEASDASAAFRDDRALPGTAPMDMASKGMPGEMAVQDHFAREYTGKIMPDGTEIVSTGIEALATQNGTLNLAIADREHLMYALSVLDLEPPVLDERTSVEQLKKDNQKALNNIQEAADKVNKLPEEEKVKLTDFLSTEAFAKARESLVSDFQALHKTAGDAYRDTTKFINETLSGERDGVGEVLSKAGELVAAAIKTAKENPEFAAVGAIGAIAAVSGAALAMTTISLPTIIGVGGLWNAITAFMGKQTLKQIGIAYLKGTTKQIAFNMGVKLTISGVLATVMSSLTYGEALKKTLQDKQKIREGQTVDKEETRKKVKPIFSPFDENFFNPFSPFKVTYK